MVQLGVAGMLGTSIPTKTAPTNVSKDNVLSGVGGIKGIGTGAGVGAKKEMNTVAPVKESVKNIPPTTTGRITKSSTEDKPMVLAAIDMLQGQKTADDISKEYAGKLSSDSFSKTVDLVTDIYNGSGLVELNKAYSDIPRTTIDDIFQAHNAIRIPQENPGVIKNFVTGFLGELPKEVANTASYVFKSITNPTGSFLDIFNIKDNSAKGKLVDKSLEPIKKLGEEAKMQIDATIGGDESTKMYKAGQIIMDILPALVTRKPGQKLGMEAATALEEASTKFPKLLEFIRNPKVNKLVQNAIASVPQTEAFTIASEGKSSSPAELGFGAIANTIPGNKTAKTKEGVIDVIREQNIGTNLKDAFSRGGVKEMPTRLSKAWNGVSDMIKPSQKTYNSVNTIVKEIKNVSKDPQKLYTQISNKVGELSTKLSSKLKEISIENNPSLVLNVNSKLDDLVLEAKSYSPTLVKAIQQAKKSLSNISNLDDVWSSAKTLDDFIPESIKNSVGKGGKDEIIYGKWREARTAFNDLLDSTAENIGDTTVKEEFKKMSLLFHAKNQILDNAKTIYKTTRGIKQKLGELGENGLKIYFLGKMLGGADTHGQVNTSE